MAIGTISSPASWLVGTPASPTWFQNVQDTVNALYAYVDAQTYYRIIPAMAPNYRTNGAHWAPNNAVSLTTSGASEFLLVPLIFDATSASVYDKITAVSAYIDPGGASAVSIQLLQTTDLTAGAPTTSSLGTASTSGTSYQAVTIPSLNIGATDVKYIYMLVTSGQASDLYYGCRITYNNSLYI